MGWKESKKERNRGGEDLWMLVFEVELDLAHFANYFLVAEFSAQHWTDAQR